MKIEEYTFTKKNGEITTIIGTRDFKALDSENFQYVKDYQSKRKVASHLTVFWDIKKDMFKSYITENLISKREVKTGYTKIRLEDGDFYNKRVGAVTILKKHKTPYFILSILNTFETRTKKQLIESLEYISTKMKISQNQKRNTMRVISAFQQNGLVYQYNDHYVLTELGRNFLSQNVG